MTTYTQDELDTIAEYHNWATIDQDDNGIVTWNSKPGATIADIGWRCATAEQIHLALRGQHTKNLVRGCLRCDADAD